MRSRLPALLTATAVALGGLTALSLTTAAPASASPTRLDVPTAAAGLGEIVTAPNGTMWFVEEDANKVGMIVGGRITKEIAFPADFDTTTVKDVAAAPDSSVWVLYQQGRSIAHLDPNGTVLGSADLPDYQFGDDVEVAPDGTVYFTVSDGGDSYVRFVQGGTIGYYPNSPECVDSLGLGANGTPWCRTSGGLTRLNAPGTGGGSAFPANSYAAYPYAIAAGPVGDVWFGRYFGGTFATSPDDGEVGYLNAATSQVVAFDTGERTAPADLVRGPDNAMWFTSVGAAKGIGHVDASGRGALTQVGGYEPESLTFGPDGAVWFTDAENNVIVRVPTSELQTTNVDPGAGSVLTGSSGGGGVKVKAGKKPLAVSKGKVPLTLTCTAASTCSGKVKITSVKKVGKGKKAKYVALTKPASFSIPAGAKGKVKLKVTGKGGRFLGRGTTKVRVVVGDTTVGKVKVRR